MPTPVGPIDRDPNDPDFWDWSGDDDPPPARRPARAVVAAILADRAGTPRGPERVLVAELFTYAIDKRYLPLLLPLGLRPSRDGVTTTDDGLFVATFGFLKVTTELANVDGAHITRNYRWWTAVGPRMSLADDGLTFGTNADAGVCVHFHEKVRSPLRPSGHSALTVTVADLDGLTSALTRT